MPTGEEKVFLTSRWGKHFPHQLVFTALIIQYYMCSTLCIKWYSLVNGASNFIFLLYIMIIGHSFKIQILYCNSSFKCTSICSLPGFSADGLQPPMRSDGGLFGAARRFKCADDSMLTLKASDWEFQKEVYHFCTPEIDRVIVWHLMLHSAIDGWPWQYPCTVNVVR